MLASSKQHGSNFTYMKATLDICMLICSLIIFNRTLSHDSPKKIYGKAHKPVIIVNIPLYVNCM